MVWLLSIRTAADDLYCFEIKIWYLLIVDLLVRLVSCPFSAKMDSIRSVVVDALVVMKILKHARDNGHEQDAFISGPLLGLVVDNDLEVTNCFPLPQVEDESASSADYQYNMMRWLRAVNVDHMHVGWYQVSELGSFFDEEVARTQFEHQKLIKESVVLIYDPIITTQGSLSVRAFRLTNDAMKTLSNGDFSAAALKAAKLTYRNLFQEVPVVMKLSPLAKVLVPDLTANLKQSEVFDRLDLSTHTFMEKNIRHLMERIDELAGETSKYQNYYKQLKKQEDQIEIRLAQLPAENEARRAKGQHPWSEDDVRNSFKALEPPSRLDSLLITAQINNYCKQVSQFNSQSFGKLYLAKAVQAMEATEASS
eukprot:TRINITY_DN7021_c0_g1_i4.p1 TRINITY_DN7021_c0_g1~~TRINITY_DN7021_c0_g1_i4.p1  ORF type:complete len:366 (+),score=71.02 TRINITY_DN7021_c0_g1_i4:88-1185(+)